MSDYSHVSDFLTVSSECLSITKSDCSQLLHDLKTPFNGIVGLTEAMKMMVRDEKNRNILSHINKCGTRYVDYVEKSLDVEMLNKGHSNIYIPDSAFSIYELVSEAITISQYAIDISTDKPYKKEGVSVEFMNEITPNSLNKTEVYLDEVMTSRILYAIFFNAVIFTDEGRIEVELVENTSKQGFFDVIVKDTGIGIDSVGEEIFEPFARFNYRDRYHDSKGLGLSIARECAFLMGGSLHYSPNQPNGSIFTLSLPINCSKLCPMGTSLTRGPEGFEYYIKSSKTDPSNMKIHTKRKLGTLSHELKTPFIGVLGLSRKLFELETKKPIQKQLNMVTRCAERLASILEVVCDSSLLLEKRMSLNISNVHIARLIQSVFSQLEVARDKRNQPLKKNEISFFNECPGNIPDIQADGHLIYKVIYHLVENALKFTIKGKVRVDAKFSKESISIIVEDSGIGIPPENHEKIFQPFVRVEPQNFYGIGLGLSVVYDVIRLHEGSIEIDSGAGLGTAISVTLPIQYDTSANTLAQQSKQYTTGGRFLSSTNLRSAIKESESEEKVVPEPLVQPLVTEEKEEDIDNKSQPSSDKVPPVFVEEKEEKEEIIQQRKEDVKSKVVPRMATDYTAATTSSLNEMDPISSNALLSLESKLNLLQTRNMRLEVDLETKNECLSLVAEHLNTVIEFLDKVSRSELASKDIVNQLDSLKKISNSLTNTKFKTLKLALYEYFKIINHLKVDLDFLQQSNDRLRQEKSNLVSQNKKMADKLCQYEERIVELEKALEKK